MTSPSDERGATVGVKGHAGGVLMCGGDHNGVSPRCTEMRRVGTHGINGDRRDRESLALHQLSVRRQAGVFHPDDAGTHLRECAAHELQAVTEALADDDVVGVGDDASGAAEVARQYVAQCIAAARVPVAECRVG